MAFWQRDTPPRLTVDASLLVLGVILEQKQKGGYRVTSYATRSLSRFERRYFQTISRRFRLLPQGTETELITDDKVYLQLFSRTSIPPARIKRQVLRIQGYKRDIKYKQGTTNLAESLLTLQKEIEKSKSFTKEYVNIIIQNNTIPTLTLEQIKTETKKQKTSQQFLEKLKTNSWEKRGKDIFILQKNHN